jgi:hypothetical protein
LPGGQSAPGALSFHPGFDKTAVANSGCHDNRLLLVPGGGHGAGGRCGERKLMVFSVRKLLGQPTPD